ncbi:MAG: flavin reductase family protein [Tannerella sp.]|jgi:flavin reductase (DIM6/NTAB) family NADH-FMN oxidoreductase RutF|nr:flavin reductase family protein [Tannerella sp.]
MKKNILYILIICGLVACTNGKKPEQDENSSKTDSIVKTALMDMKTVPFDELFTETTADQIDRNIIALVKTFNIVITAGRDSDYNSMVAGDGGIGILMGKPVTFCGLRGSRRTLEVILKDSVYTMSFFKDKYRDDYLIFGQKSGRNTEKMKETRLTSVVTPSGKMAFKEAFMIIECQLAQTHTVNPAEVYADDNRLFFEDAYKEVGSYHKIVFGDITNVWIRKKVQ